MSSSRILSLALMEYALMHPAASADSDVAYNTCAESMTPAQARAILGLSSGKGSGGWSHSPGTSAKRAWKVRRQFGHGGRR